MFYFNNRHRSCSFDRLLFLPAACLPKTASIRISSHTSVYYTTGFQILKKEFTTSCNFMEFRSRGAMIPARNNDPPGKHPGGQRSLFTHQRHLPYSTNGTTDPSYFPSMNSAISSDCRASTSALMPSFSSLPSFTTRTLA